MEDKKSGTTYTEKQVVVFNLAKEEFGVDIGQVREIIKFEDITKIPNTDEYIDGVINLRGKIIVIVDLAKKLNLVSNGRNKDTRIIVIELKGSEIGMIVDGCNEVLRLPGNQIEPAPEIIKNKISADYLEGVGILKDRLIIILNLMNVIVDKDLSKVQEISKSAPAQ